MDKKSLVFVIVILFIFSPLSYFIFNNEENPVIENKDNLSSLEGNENEVNLEITEVSNIVEEKDYSTYITSESESNKDYVKYISNGMNIDDLKEIIDKEDNYIISNDIYEKVNYNFDKHLSYSELSNIFEKLNNSNIVALEIIGKSVDNRNIYSLEIGKGDKEILLEGNIHAAEIAPLLFLTKFSVDLVNKYEENDEETTLLLKEVKFVIVPSINPDGYDYSVFGKNLINNKNTYVYLNDNKIDNKYYKANLNGVDLNRNFPSQTSGLYFKDKGLSYDVSTTRSTSMFSYFPGDYLASEPETKALMYFMYKHYKNTNAYISLHSAGRVVYDEQQYLSDTFNSEARKCSSLIAKYTNYYKVGIDYDDGLGNDGNSTDFISELSHGLKISEETGRLTTDKYTKKLDTMPYKMCVVTIETLENYTQDLNIIKNEYYNKSLSKALIEIAKRK